MCVCVSPSLALFHSVTFDGIHCVLRNTFNLLVGTMLPSEEIYCTHYIRLYITYYFTEATFEIYVSDKQHRKHHIPSKTKN